MLVAEAVDIFAVETSYEGVVAGGDGALVGLVVVGWVLYLHPDNNGQPRALYSV